jgi:hypothetical protein
MQAIGLKVNICRLKRRKSYCKCKKVSDAMGQLANICESVLI